eukprot:CFRG7329T1
MWHEESTAAIWHEGENYITLARGEQRAIKETIVGLWHEESTMSIMELWHEESNISISRDERIVRLWHEEIFSTTLANISECSVGSTVSVVKSSD